MTADVDVAVVGGGPVGLAAAIEARLSGLSVVVIEPREFPIDKACGEGLMPGALAALGRLGVEPAGRTIAGFRYLDGRRSASYRFRGLPGMGVRRTALHDALAARVAELGIERLHSRVSEVEQDAAVVTAAGVTASWLLACDGLHSGIRRGVGLERPARSGRGETRRRFGLRQHFAVAPWTDLVEVHWSREVEVYVTPVADDLVGVALLGPARSDYGGSLERIPELWRHLDGAAAVGGLRGAGPLRQRSRARTAGRVLLVGDSSGYVDALTGEGIRVGLAQAHAAVQAITGDEDAAAAGYERAWSRSTRDFRVLTSALLAAAQSPGRGVIVPAAKALPSLFGTIVERLAR